VALPAWTRTIRSECSSFVLVAIRSARFAHPAESYRIVSLPPRSIWSKHAGPDDPDLPVARNWRSTWLRRPGGGRFPLGIEAVKKPNSLFSTRTLSGVDPQLGSKRSPQLISITNLLDHEFKLAYRIPLQDTCATWLRRVASPHERHCCRPYYNEWKNVVKLAEAIRTLPDKSTYESSMTTLRWDRPVATS